METIVNDANFESEVINSELPVLIDFWAPWCAPCHMVSPIVEEIGNEYAEKLKVCKINVDEAPGVSRQYGIRAIPTLMVFKDGEMVDQQVGVVPKEVLLTKVTPYL
ncbi:MAG: thioredoxin [Candidatus Auribacterota bacterium]|nr:thioredoxin [Candidatus Auribacterota bacterium]